MTTASVLTVILLIPEEDAGCYWPGLKTPVALINLITHPLICWIISHLKFHPDDKIFIALNNRLAQEHNVITLLQKYYPKFNFQTLLSEKGKNRVQDVVQQVTRMASQESFDGKIVMVFFDAICFSDVLELFRKLPNGAGGSAYVRETAGDRLCLRFDKGQNIIAEALKLSKGLGNVCIGVYCFPNAKLLSRYVEKYTPSQIDQNESSVVSGLVRKMIEDVHEFHGCVVEDFVRVGSKEEVGRAMIDLKKKDNLMPKRPIIIDVDSLLHVMGAELLTRSYMQMVMGEFYAVLKEMKKLGYDVKLSFSKGGGILENESEFDFVEIEERQKAVDAGRLYEFNDAVLTAIGWTETPSNPLAYMFQ